jgi:thioesterase domain-containing protein
MAAHYIEEIRTLQPEGPYFIGGHCIGGLIAFEMAQQLHRQGERVGLLALFDSYAPRRGRARSSLFYRYRYKTIRLFEMTVGLHVNNLLIIEPKERLSYLREKFNKALYKLYMGLGSAWIPAARQRRNILRAGSQASRNYDPKIYPGKITLFRATNLGGGIDHDPQMGWGRLAGGGLEQGLGIGVEHPVSHPLEVGGDHAVHRVASPTPHTDHLDPSRLARHDAIAAGRGLAHVEVLLRGRRLGREIDGGKSLLFALFARHRVGTGGAVDLRLHYVVGRVR